MKHPASISLVLVLLAVATASAAAMDGGGAANYLVYVDPHPPGVDCQKYQLGILAAALGGYLRLCVCVCLNTISHDLRLE